MIYAEAAVASLTAPRRRLPKLPPPTGLAVVYDDTTMSEIRAPQPESPKLGYAPENPSLTPWADAEAALIEANTYWLGSVRTDGHPHAMPVWGVWVESRFFFSTSATSRKGQNLAANPGCTVSLSARGLDIVIEGTAAHLTDDATAQIVAGLYAPKYDWPVTVRDAGLYSKDGEGGPLYAVTPRVIFAFGLTGGFTATRWRF
jgi:hypothetical protein